MLKKISLGAAILAAVALPATEAMAWRAYGGGYRDPKSPAIYKAPPPPVYTTNWTGFYIGGHLGGAWGKKEWADPYGQDGFVGTLDGLVIRNAGGFGQEYPVHGPLAGGQVGFNYQVGYLVFGAEAQFSWADLRGSNTCFSGIGGVQCESQVRGLRNL